MNTTARLGRVSIVTRALRAGQKTATRGTDRKTFRGRSPLLGSGGKMKAKSCTRRGQWHPCKLGQPVLPASLAGQCKVKAKSDTANRSVVPTGACKRDGNWLELRALVSHGTS